MPGNNVIGRNVVLIGQDYVADGLGVTSQAISMWYKREAEDVAGGLPAWGMPTPVPLLYAPGKKPSRVWRLGQMPAWRRFYAKRHPAATAAANDEREARAA